MEHGLRIGGFRPATPLFLCPLAGYTDLPFRRLIRPLGGLGLAFTELVSPRGLREGSKRSLELVETADDDRPLAIQLYGTDAEALAEAAAWAAERGSPIVDLNMGCPAPKIAGKGGGSGLLRECPNAVRLAEAVVKRCPAPVTVKTRLGWAMHQLVAPELVRQLEDVGVAAVTIHGRYGTQKFSGSCDLDGIARTVAAARRIPVLGNGDIRSPRDALEMFRRTGCAGVMIGRRALADPWIFRDAAALLATGVHPPPPDKRERVALMTRHFDELRRRHGDAAGVVQFRTRAAWHVKCLAPAPRLRRELPSLKSVAEYHDLVGAYLDALDRGDADVETEGESEAAARAAPGHAPDERWRHCVRQACVLEAWARKPGNVHRERDFPDLRYQDFLRSAAAVAPELARAPGRPLGETILAALRATRAAVRTNTNLGIVLLLAPLCKTAAGPRDEWPQRVHAALAETTIADAELAYEAIRLAQPGGMGEAPEQDVANVPTVTLRAAMALAADRDRIAKAYADGFRDVFGVHAMNLARLLGQGGDAESAILQLFLAMLAAEPDSLIARQRGAAVAAEVQRRAGELAQVQDHADPRLAAFDAWLREQRANPGATADFVAAALFCVLWDGNAELARIADSVVA